MTIGERIKYLRTSLNMTQDELAKLTGYKSRSSIQKIEAGERDITQSTIVSFANALKVSPSEIMGWEDTVYLPSVSTDKLEAYLSDIYLPNNESKAISKRYISKAEALTTKGLIKLEERVDELIALGGDYVRDDYKKATEKITEINNRKCLSEYTQNIAAATGKEGMTDEKISEVMNFAEQIRKFENDT